MNITLKNVKYNEKLSRDSHCYTATLYVDGKKMFGVMEDGWGSYDIETYKVKGGVEDIASAYAEIDAEIKKTTRESKERDDLGLPPMDNCLDFVCCDLVNEFLRDREIKKDLRTITYMNDGEMYGVKLKPTPENVARIKQQKWWKDTYIILNTMPIEDVRQYYK